MTWVDIFDLIRHVIELLFYVIAGPLLSLFAVKQMRHQRRLEQQMLELQQHVRELAARDDSRLAPAVTLFVENTSADRQQPLLAPPDTKNEDRV